MSAMTHTIWSGYHVPRGNRSNDSADSCKQTRPDDSNGRRCSYAWACLFVWPLVLLLIEMMNYVVYLKSRKLGACLFPQMSSQNKLEDYVLAAISHVTTLAFVAVLFWWIILAMTCDDEDSAETSKGVSAVLLVIGWMYMLEYLRCLKKLHALVIIFKLIFIKDVLWIMCIFVVILLGFGTAVSIYLDLTWIGCIYHVYATMLGDGKLFEDEAISGSSGIRAVFAIYLLMSVVVLLNMLIAMMNNRYSKVVEIKHELWYIETVHSIAWLNCLFPHAAPKLFDRLTKNIVQTNSKTNDVN